MTVEDKIEQLAAKLPLFAQKCVTIDNDEAANKLGIVAQFQVVSKDWGLLATLFEEIAASEIQQETRRGMQVARKRTDFNVSVSSVAWISGKPTSGIKVVIWGGKPQASTSQQPTVQGPIWSNS